MAIGFLVGHLRLGWLVRRGSPTLWMGGLSLSLSLSEWLVRVVAVPSQIQVRLHGFHYKSTPTYVIPPSPFDPLTFNPRFHDPLYHSVPPSCADHGRALPSARAKETSWMYFSIWINANIGSYARMYFFSFDENAPLFDSTNHFGRFFLKELS